MKPASPGARHAGGGGGEGGGRRGGGRGRSGARGFTLLETIIVIVVLGLMLAIVAGFMPRRSNRLELASAADVVAGTLRLARARAIASGRQVTVRVDGHALVVDGVTRSLPGREGITLAGTQVIRFAVDGSASGGAVTVADETLALVVTVEWLTGRVVVANARAPAR